MLECLAMQRDLVKRTVGLCKSSMNEPPIKSRSSSPLAAPSLPVSGGGGGLARFRFVIIAEIVLISVETALVLHEPYSPTILLITLGARFENHFSGILI